jgi:hypothetical protein
MVEVELVEDGPPPPDPGPDPATAWVRRAVAATRRRARRALAFAVPRALRASRRPWLRWVAGALAATLVAVPVAQASRERTRLAALAQVPGVVGPLHPDLHPVFRVAADSGQVLQQGFRVGGVVAAAVSGRTGTPSVVGLDASTGAHRWSTALQPAGDPTDSVWEAPVCGAAGSVILCTGSEQLPTPETTWMPTRTTAWVLDPADGHVLRSVAYDEHTWATGAGGLLVVARQSSGPARAPAAGPWTVTWQVTGEDPATGAVRWSWASPRLTVGAGTEEQNASHDPTDYVSWLVGASPMVAPDDVELAVGDDTWLLGVGGAVLTHVARPGGWQVGTQGRAILRVANADPVGSTERAAELLTDDGAWRAVDGYPLWPVVDDASVPDVLVRAVPGTGPDGGVLVGIDRHTGGTLWRTQTGPGVNNAAVLLEGRLYLGNPLRAIDVATGAVLWTAEGSAGASLLTTDGSVLLVGVADATAHVNVVEARSLRDGRLLWTTDLRALVLPSGKGNLAQVWASPALRRLVASRADGSAAVLG